jgi:hypothetical protein
LETGLRTADASAHYHQLKLGFQASGNFSYLSFSYLFQLLHIEFTSLHALNVAWVDTAGNGAAARLALPNINMQRVQSLILCTKPGIGRSLHYITLRLDAVGNVYNLNSIGTTAQTRRTPMLATALRALFADCEYACVLLDRGLEQRRDRLLEECQDKEAAFALEIPELKQVCFCICFSFLYEGAHYLNEFHFICNVDSQRFNAVAAGWVDFGFDVAATASTASAASAATSLDEAGTLSAPSIANRFQDNAAIEIGDDDGDDDHDEGDDKVDHGDSGNADGTAQINLADEESSQSISVAQTRRPIEICDDDSDDGVGETDWKITLAANLTSMLFSDDSPGDQGMLRCCFLISCIHGSTI